MFYLIAVGFWALLVLLVVLFFIGAGQLEREWQADRLLLTREERDESA